MRKGLKYLLILGIMCVVGFTTTMKDASRTVDTGPLSVVMVVTTTPQFSDGLADNSSGYGVLTDEVKKKRSHKRRRKVRPPKKGR